jgi:hypothetical protein
MGILLLLRQRQPPRCLRPEVSSSELKYRLNPSLFAKGVGGNPVEIRMAFYGYIFPSAITVYAVFVPLSPKEKTVFLEMAD